MVICRLRKAMGCYSNYALPGFLPDSLRRSPDQTATIITMNQTTPDFTSMPVNVRSAICFIRLLYLIIRGNLTRYQSWLISFPLRF